MRLMISGGGTGGHVYPALAVVRVLDNNSTPLWVGSQNGIEKALLAKTNIPYEGISAAGLRGKNVVAMATSSIKLLQGYRQSRQLLNNFKPDVLFVTGGYVCVPVTLAAYRMGIPILIYLPDIEPGQAIKFLSRYASKIAVTAPPAQNFFREGLTVVTGYPVRDGLYKTESETARRTLSLDPNLPTLLVFGGSQGARSINKAITRPQALAQLLAQMQIIHISGEQDAIWTQAIRQDLTEAQQSRYHLYPYLHEEMVAAFAAADLIVSRAGASILGEAPAVGVPSILVPYPYGGAHQWPNARYLSEQGAAIIVADDELEKSLINVILTTLNNTKQRSSMSQAARRLARPQAAEAIAMQIKELYYERDKYRF